MYLVPRQVADPQKRVIIDDGRLAVTCAPAQGFTILSILDGSTGAEALWQRSAHVPAPCTRALGPAGAASVETFVDLWLGGWFEMFPEVGFPTPGDGASLLHGEVVRLPWEVVARSRHAVEAHVRLVRRPIELTRRLTVEDGRLRIEERATHVGVGGPVELAWGHHPCFARETFAGGRLDLPVERAYVPQPLDAVNAILRAGPIARWPSAHRRDGTPIDPSAIPSVPDGRSDHVCVEMAAGWARLTAPRFGRALRIDFPVEPFGHVLLWEDMRAPSGWPLWGSGDTIAVELASGPGRTTPELREAGALQTLHPHASLDVEITVGWESTR